MFSENFIKFHIKYGYCLSISTYSRNLNVLEQNIIARYIHVVTKSLKNTDRFFVQEILSDNSQTYKKRKTMSRDGVFS